MKHEKTDECGLLVGTVSVPARSGSFELTSMPQLYFIQVNAQIICTICYSD